MLADLCGGAFVINCPIKHGSFVFEDMIGSTQPVTIFEEMESFQMSESSHLHPYLDGIDQVLVTNPKYQQIKQVKHSKYKYNIITTNDLRQFLRPVTEEDDKIDKHAKHGVHRLLARANVHRPKYVGDKTKDTVFDAMGMAAHLLQRVGGVILFFSICNCCF